MSFNHSERAQSRIVWQYRNATRFRQWIDALPNVAQEPIENTALLIRDVLDLDNVTGWRLDIIGNIVGQPRDSNLLADDNTYRIVIRSRIARNNSDVTIDGIRQAIEFVTQDAVFDLIDNQDMTFNIVFESPLNDLVKELILTIDLIPRPQGVGFNGFIEPQEFPVFGFREGEDGAFLPFVDGFGELGSEFLMAFDDGTILEGEPDGALSFSDDDEGSFIGPGGHLSELFEVP